MAIVALAAKAIVAVILLVAGGAKLADLAGFGAAVRLLVPLRLRPAWLRGAALAIALTELALGAASLALPGLGWADPAVFALSCGFVVVAAVGMRYHRGRSCRCFGGLTNRTFDARGVARAVAIAVAAGLALGSAPHTMVDLSGTAQALLLAAAALTALASFSAARSLGLARTLDPEAP